MPNHWRIAPPNGSISVVPDTWQTGKIRDISRYPGGKREEVTSAVPMRFLGALDHVRRVASVTA